MKTLRILQDSFSSGICTGRKLLVNLTMFKRLDYLFEVIKVPHMFNDEFVGKCAEEIQNMLTIPEKDKEDNSEED